MIPPIRELEAAVLALPIEERARLAERLLSSLDENVERANKRGGYPGPENPQPPTSQQIPKALPPKKS